MIDLDDRSDSTLDNDLDNDYYQGDILNSAYHQGYRIALNSKQSLKIDILSCPFIEGLDRQEWVRGYETGYSIRSYLSVDLN